jgi:hypothetical protein
LIINLGYLARNYQTYGHPISGADRITEHANQDISIRGAISNILRNAGLHAGTPWDSVNLEIYRGIVGVHFKLGIPLNAPKTTGPGSFRILKPSASENLAGNTLHAVFILGTVFISMVLKRFHPKTVIYGLVLVMTFVIFSLLFKWQIFGSRYHLPSFSSIIDHSYRILRKCNHEVSCWKVESDYISLEMITCSSLIGMSLRRSSLPSVQKLALLSVAWVQSIPSGCIWAHRIGLSSLSGS